MGKRSARKTAAPSLSALVRAEDAAEEEILEAPPLSSMSFGGSVHQEDDDEEEDDDARNEEEEEAEIERQLVEEQRAQQAGEAAPKGIYNRVALEALAAEWDGQEDKKGVALPWVETLDTCAAVLDLADVHDDLKREVAFYNNTLANVRIAKQRLLAENIAYKRPADYFAEMLKSDRHMAKVKDKLIYEQKKISAVEERKKSQAHRKVAKELQSEKIKQRNQQKKDTLEAVKQWKKRRNQNDSTSHVQDNDQELDAIMSGKGAPSSTKRKRDQGDGRTHGNGSVMNKKPRVNKKREGKDKQYGFGGPKRHAKSNTRASTNDFSKFPRNQKKGPAAGPKGKAGGKPKASQRAGKAKRDAHRSKGRR